MIDVEECKKVLECSIGEAEAIIPREIIPENKNEVSEMLKIITDYKEDTEGFCPKCKANLKKVSGVNIIKYCPCCGEKIRIKTQENDRAE